MLWFRSVSNDLIRDEATRLVHNFSIDCPPPSEARGQVPEKRAQQALDALYAAAKAFSRQHGLGVWKRAKFAKLCQDELLKKGYQPAMVSKITAALTANALVGK